MDSMNSLQGSLPLSASRRNNVLAPFRETACSLTALFKTAQNEIDRAYADGARSALEQLLSGMDRENLGLEEGEGWRVRQMVMGLYEGLQADEGVGRVVAPSSEPEEEQEMDRTSLASSPVRQQEIRPVGTLAHATRSLSQQPIIEEPEEEASPKETAPQNTTGQLPTTDFDFRSSYASPLFSSLPEPTSPSDASRTPTLPTNFDFFNIQRVNLLSPSKTKPGATLGQGAGTKRRSKSPPDTSNATTKRSRRNAMEH
jgi:hypothetical protein